MELLFGLIVAMVLGILFVYPAFMTVFMIILKHRDKHSTQHGIQNTRGYSYHTGH